MIIRRGSQKVAARVREVAVGYFSERRRAAADLARQKSLQRGIAEVTTHQGMLGVAENQLVWVFVDGEAGAEMVRLVRLTGGACEAIESCSRGRIMVLPWAATPAVVALATGGLSDSVLANWSELQVCVLARALATWCCATMSDDFHLPGELSVKQE